MFATHHESHKHSLQTLSLLEQHGDFMESIDSVLDIGCGKGLDTEWWATRCLLDDDDNSIPLNINCTALDIKSTYDTTKYDNVTIEIADYETYISDKKYDVLWCHNSFQYCINPMNTLLNWRNVLNDGGMLCIEVPSTINMEYNRLSMRQYSQQYYDFTMLSMMHWLAIAGYETSFVHLDRFNKDNWLKVIAYKTVKSPLDPRETTWYDLADTELLPESVVKSINKHGYPIQQELVLEWIDHNLVWYGSK